MVTLLHRKQCRSGIRVRWIAPNQNPGRPSLHRRRNADPKLTALGEGLVESVAAKLGKLTEDRAFEVVPPGNLQEKKISNLPDAAHMFGANLGLTLTLESQSADLVKVTYSVLSAQTSAPLGTGSLTVPSTDAFSAEQVIADGTVKALRLQLRPEEEAALKYHGTDNAEAYEYYLQAQGYLLDHTKSEKLDIAALMAREALKLDPNFGMAKAVLGESYWLKYSDTKQKQWLAPAQSDCNDAVKLGNCRRRRPRLPRPNRRRHWTLPRSRQRIPARPRSRTYQRGSRSSAWRVPTNTRVRSPKPKKPTSKPFRPTPTAAPRLTISAHSMSAATSTRRR